MPDNTQHTEPLVTEEPQDAQQAAGKCPVMHGLTHPTQGSANQQWWPNKLNLRILAKNPAVADPFGGEFDYKAAFLALDLDEVKADVKAVLTDSKDFWPADFGHYGPLFVRMAWHAAGTYRATDGRGGAGHGQQRFAPTNSWPDNGNLDKARRLLWPVKKKYGKSLSWGDLMILAGNVAQEDMGFPIFGFGGGRPDVWEADEDVYWGPETEWLEDERYTGERDLEDPLAAVQMGLIYVNPEGPNGNPDPLASAVDIKDTFGRMGMTVEETVALIAGGHTFGKTHGNGPAEAVGPEPEAAPIEEQGLGWRSSHASGKGIDAITSGLEVTWTYHPTRWDNEFFHILFGYEWELFKSPAGAQQWRPKNNGGADLVPESFGDGKREPRMLTSDIALREDPEMREISLRFKDDQDAFTDAYGRAWFKLTHRDMGPKSRYLGADVPAEDFVWQDPIPAGTALTDAQVTGLKNAIAEAGLSVSQLVSTAWASASTYRSSDKRGGANGARIALEPQRSWAINRPAELAPILTTLQEIATAHGASLADTIVIAGSVGVEQAAAAAGVNVTVTTTTGRGDATQEQTDVESFGYLEPKADGFRNYLPKSSKYPSEFALVDRANLLGVSAPELTALIGGLRVLGTNWDGSDLGVLTDRPGVLTNDFFVNLLDLGTTWTATDASEEVFRGTTESGTTWTGSRNDLVFGSNSELRAVAEVYASDDAQEKFVRDFVAAWTKVMDADRWDLR
ncbi:catalase/peroxidase HPI [Nocardioides carbamazepini]|uniref:catalase/peroxidase HPI n=1 Tax=Nocardioides carbamazepini TaxID=2854259 RepID=UPI00214A8863|nr:catalase/peroxidase HPI [Nocardioides carbamazepini]MCR1782346.1 catalase/peroxidase HPI [Nocardioides carbamazepini]